MDSWTRERSALHIFTLTS